MKTISNKGLSLIMHYESLHDGDLSMIGLQPKMCPAGYWTEGYGHVIVVNGKMLKGKENKELALKHSVIKNAQDAVYWLDKDLDPIKKQINKLTPDLNQNEFDAVCSFVYNVGIGNFKSSTVFKYLKDGVDNSKQSDEIYKWLTAWNKVNGKVLDGLTFRRMSEFTLFKTGELKFFNV
jgi:lysozyme